VSRRGQVARVSTYLGPRAFYSKDMANRERVSQTGPLPPRCNHCRQSMCVVMLTGQPHCPKHTPCADCQESEDV
jgi:hypothetical protein